MLNVAYASNLQVLDDNQIRHLLSGNSKPPYQLHGPHTERVSYRHIPFSGFLACDSVAGIGLGQAGGLQVRSIYTQIETAAWP